MAEPYYEEIVRRRMEMNKAAGLCVRSGLIGPWLAGKVWCEPHKGGCDAWFWVQQIGADLANIPPHSRER